MNENQRLIFCYECLNEKTNSDERIIKRVLKYYYEKQHNYYPVYMNGKDGYNHDSTNRQIKEKEFFFKKEGNIVIIRVLFIDIDTHGTYDKKRIASIKKFCDENGHELILFYKEIEDVFNISKDRKRYKTKLDAAIAFVENPELEKINETNLTKQHPSKKGESNILFVLDKYFERKNSN